MKKDSDFVIVLIACIVFGFFGGIAFINNILAIGKKNPEIEIYNVPFLASVWGTVSDWIMVFITLISAYLLIKTFQEQKNINRASLLPIFTVELIPTKVLGPNRYRIKLCLIKNTAYYIAPSRSYNGFTTNTWDFPLIIYLAEGESFELDCSLNIGAQVEPLILTLLRFSFKDVSGTTYFQEITYNKLLSKFSLNVPNSK